MYKIKCTVFLSCLFNFFQTVYSQSKLYPGYYIDNKNDSVYCKIEFNDWSRNPKSIQVDVNNQKKVFIPFDIKGFGVYNYSNYKTAIVSYHINPISGTNLPEEYSDSVETKSYFLQVLIKGFYSLYELTLPERPVFFISRNDSTVSELIYRVKQNGMTIAEDKSYKNLLYDYFYSEGIWEENQNEINSAIYSGDRLESLIKKLNNKHSGENALNKATKTFQLDGFIGGNLNLFPTRVAGFYSPATNFNSGFSLTGGINVLYTIPGRFKRFGVGVSIGYNSYNLQINKSDSIFTNVSPNYYYTIKYNEKLTAKNSIIQSNLYTTFCLNPFSETKVYFKAGLTFNISLDNFANIVDAYNDVATGIQNGNVPFSYSGNDSKTHTSILSEWINFNAGFGISKKRNKIELLYYSPQKIGVIVEDKSSFKMSTLGFYYYYTLY